MKLYNLAIFASGNGSNAENLYNYFKKNDGIKISKIFTNNPNAGVIERFKNLDVQIYLFSKEDFNDIAFLNKLKDIEYIVLAGFLWLIPEYLIKAFPNKIINIHPSLLPKYGGKGMYGMKVHEAVKANHEHETGITIHFVNEQYDKGEIILQKSCSINFDDSPNTISEKVHQLEHYWFPISLEMILN